MPTFWETLCATCIPPDSSHMPLISAIAVSYWYRESMCSVSCASRLSDELAQVAGRLNVNFLPPHDVHGITIHIFRRFERVCDFL